MRLRADMDLSQINVDQLATKLRPYLDDALKELTEFGSEFASDLSKEASSGLASLTIGAFRSLGSAAWKRIKSSKARAAFDRQWEKARSDNDKENAIRALLKSDPRLASALYGLLVRRDFVRAMMEYCEHLPNVGLLDSTRRLSDIYVTPSLKLAEAASDADDERSAAILASRVSGDSVIDQLKSGNHLIEGIPGSGKSTLTRHFVISESFKLLNNLDVVAFDQVRIPVFVSAQTLYEAKSDFASSLKYAVDRDMSFAALGPVPDEFFVPYSNAGHSYWLIVIDGLDEIESRRERQRLWDSIRTLHSQFGDAFRFVVTSRPNAVRINADDIGFERWSVQPLATAARDSLARKYISDNATAERFLERIRHGEFAEIASTPLFEAIAASVFAKTGQLPNSKLELCEEFTFALMEKSVPLADGRNHALTRLLSEISIRSRIDLSSFGEDLNNEIRLLVPSDLPKLRLQEFLEELLTRTGLVRLSGGIFAFIHDVFRSYFMAVQLAQTYEPSAEVWKSVDPFSVGWTTTEYLCDAWHRAGKDISAPTEALLSFGEDGERCVTEISTTCSDVNPQILEAIVERILREMFSTGATVNGVSALTRLARRHALVRKRLVEVATGHRDFIGARVECAECLVEAGHFSDASGALLRIAKDRHGYEYDRVRAAEILLKNGHPEPGYSTLHFIARNGDQLWVRAEAACILFENLPSDEHRDLLVEILQQQADDFDHISHGTFARLLALGEKEIALPALRERARIRSDERMGFPRDEIEAAIAIATHHDLSEGRQALRTLLASPLVLIRGKAEVLDALCKIGADTEARNCLKELVHSCPEYKGTDWFVLDLLIRLQLFKEAEAVGMHLVNIGLDGRRSGVDLEEIIDALAPIVERQKLVSPVKTKLTSTKSSYLARCLAKLGHREEALTLLKLWLKDPDFEIQVSASAALCALGERSIGLRALRKLVRANKLEPEIRLAAAAALQDVGEYRSADNAYEYLLCDSSIPMENRCQAARHFDDDDLHRPDVIWRALFPFVQNDSNSFRERAIAAKELLTTDEDPDSDFMHDDVLDELFSMLESRSVSQSEMFAIASAFAKTDVTLDEIPRIKAFLADSNSSASDRIVILREFARNDDDFDAEEHLLDIVQNPNTSYTDVVDALSGADSERARELRGLLANDENVPPEWRLAIAQSHSRFRARKEAPPELLSLINDEKISVRLRLKAFSDLPKSFSNNERIALLTKIISTPQLGNWERIVLAEAALDVGAIDLAEALSSAAVADTPLSIQEKIEIAKKFRSLGHVQKAAELLKSVVSLPEFVLREIEDCHALVEGAELLAELDNRALAKDFLSRLLLITSWWNVDTILTAIESIAGSDAVKDAAAPLADDVMSAVDRHPGGYLGYWRNIFELFVTKGWISDIRPLLAIAEDQSRPIGERADAAQTLFRLSSHDKTGTWKYDARDTLVTLIQSGKSSNMDLIRMLAILDEVHPQLAERILKQLTENPQLTPEEKRAFADYLSKSGKETDAKAILKSMSLEQLASGYVGYFEKRLISELCGDDYVAKILSERAFDETEPLMDRLFEARDMVSKFGDKRSLVLIQNTATDPRADFHDRFQAVQVLDELDYRELPRRLIEQIKDDPEADDWWVGDFLLNLGNKHEALQRFVRSIDKSPKDYRDQIARSLAELGATEALEKLNQAHAE